MQFSLYILLNHLLTLAAPSDYTSGPFSITFQTGMTKVTQPVPTNRDIICEEDEYFIATITCDQALVNMVIGPDSFVTITDETGKCVVMNLHSGRVCHTKIIFYKICNFLVHTIKDQMYLLSQHHTYCMIQIKMKKKLSFQYCSYVLYVHHAIKQATYVD